MENSLDYAVILFYFAAVVGAGYWGLKLARSAEDYLVAGRRLGFPMYVGTMSAVVLGGASTVGGVSLGYQYGISGLWLVFMIGLGVVALGFLLSTRLANLGVYTVSEMLSLRYGGSAGLISAVVVSSYALMIAVTSTIALGAVFNVALGLSPVWAILIGGGVVVLYSFAGGMWSVTLTDILQFCVMTVGIFFVLLPLSVSEAGGISGMRAALPDSFFSLTAIGGGTIFTYFLLYVFGLMIGQDIWQRVFTARGPSVARWGSIAAGVYCLLYALAGALIGSAARVLLPELEAADNAFAAVAIATLPVGLLGLVLAAALAAVMSTASSALLASSTILANDVYARLARGVHNRVLISRLATLLVGVAVLGIAIAVGDVVGALTVAYNLLTGALFIPIVGALFWRRATGAGALAAMLVSSGVVIALMYTRGLFSNDPIIYGMLASLGVFVAVSLLSRGPGPQEQEAWEKRLREPVRRDELH
ncbi:sodium:solute symporter [Rubrobacter taiwanensis]|jgi:SSS family solute:Na+ symporter|uniref:Sodium:solute symporter n=1 Tax=Rubrobacter taiwanensis TaxID=185139 RepID=A0A4R1BPP6_9ACTN|nr:sodium:solute symporter [Rubrobacter taiwanensis]TCJ19673.1 sodium:solute symporter [Rubrobacter taiwanensis]